ncbi:MAG TPA: Hsp20/alpha crystallin family protein [Spirochaetia bacterium]|nr:Hsp20/alpha crystallin family protein [Spirochaetia bacterium]
MNLVGFRNGTLDPLREFEDLQEEINRLFDMTKVPEPRGIFERSFSPAMDVVENPDSFQVMCDLPGIEIQDIEISISGNVLTLKGEKRRGQKAGDPDSFREDTREGMFQRTIQLPLAVDAGKVEAVLKNGVLTIDLPKREELKPRQISVKAS